MIFGDHEDFAIEAGIEPMLPSDGRVWGHACVWCEGTAIGDLGNRFCSLHHMWAQFYWLSENLDSLWEQEFTGMGDLALWNFLDGLLYGYHGPIELPDNRTLEECRRDAQRWGRFNFLTNWGEQFDGNKSFILRPPGNIVWILSRDRANNRYSWHVPYTTFLTATRDFVLWYEQECSKLGVPCDGLS